MCGVGGCGWGGGGGVGGGGVVCGRGGGGGGGLWVQIIIGSSDVISVIGSHGHIHVSVTQRLGCMLEIESDCIDRTV